jgi:hypothetical protein
MPNINCSGKEFDIKLWFCTDSAVGDGETTNVNAFTMACDIFSGQSQLGPKLWNGIDNVVWILDTDLLKDYFAPGDSDPQCQIIWAQVTLIPVAGQAAMYRVEIGIDYCNRNEQTYHNCGDDPGEHVLVVEAEFTFDLDACAIVEEPPIA